jgi:hypothetical protein
VIPFAALAEGSTERLYALKGEIVARIRRPGVDMPVFPKRRFHTARSRDRYRWVISQDEARYHSRRCTQRSFSQCRPLQAWKLSEPAPPIGRFDVSAGAHPSWIR